VQDLLGGVEGVEALVVETCSGHDFAPQTQHVNLRIYGQELGAVVDVGVQGYLLGAV